MVRRYCFRRQRALCLVLALVCLVGIGTPAWAQFETRATNPMPYGAFSIAAGDFNHDGKLDIVVTGDNGFSVALGKGDGTFQKAVEYKTALSYSLAVADFNNDGNLDIVVANENSNPSTVSVYLGNGDGTFKAPVSSNTTSPNTFVAVGDFNGDGKPDIAVIDPPHISVLLGNGDGTFLAPSDNDSFQIPAWLAVGDFNNDHKLDVIVVGSFASSYDMGVFLGNGDGTLQSSLTNPLEYLPATVSAGDLNGDGNADAVVGYNYSGVAVFLGNGDGSFQAAVNYDTNGISGGPLVIADLSLTGRLDLAVQGGPTAGADVFWGNGDGTFQPVQSFPSGDSGLLAVGDLNGDHLPDFVMANGTYGAISMLNTGVASFSPASPVAFPVQLINTQSAPQTVSLTNNGATALSISSIRVSGKFHVSNTCGSSLAVGATCKFSAVFRPTSEGRTTGLITLVDSASSKPQVIELSGSATALKVSPGSVKFGNQKVGTTSAPQVVTATNEGSTSIQLNSVYIGGIDKRDFSETDNCIGIAIGPGASCTITVTFAPTKTGARSGTLYVIAPKGTVSPPPVPLSGTGN
jgi:hypothetical protein